MYDNYPDTFDGRVNDSGLVLSHEKSMSSSVTLQKMFQFFQAESESNHSKHAF
ncbi:hypothetical Protein YC6258_00126 [Gynuella sunshinyii YC6258]|uniref:Uncharacterized protein n=1 Tax=Gynuella sunshinyii YC6258 TaxID=1445510 RepID=A0A0C5VCG8_9GAMM|nr:hypothetical Protein YC6258_00126 [Gynuella sunshinyii YC6258]